MDDDVNPNDPTLRTANVPLRLLWAAGFVLLTVGTACAMTTASTYAAAYGQGTAGPIDFAIVNTLSSITPSLLTGGLVCIGLALAAQAITRRNQRMPVMPSATAPVDQLHEMPAAHADASATATEPARPDYQLFMRPLSDDAHSDLKHRGHTGL